MKRLLCHWRIDAEEATRAREARRLFLLAFSSQHLGFEPTLFVEGTSANFLSYCEAIGSDSTNVEVRLDGLLSGFRGSCGPNNIESDDVLLCACNPSVYPEYRSPCKVIYTNPTMNAEKDVEAAKFADVMLSRCRGRRDYYRDPGKHVVDISAEHQLHVPHVPGDGVLRQLEADGLIDALLSNDLEAIRAAYPADGPPIEVGFVGQDIAGRSELVPPRIANGWHIQYMTPGSPERRAPADYLRWLSRCRTVLDLPGERWITYRFAEARMMGAQVRAIESGAVVGHRGSHALKKWRFRTQMRRALEYIGEL